MAADEHESLDISFHEVDYVLTLSTANGDTLSIDIEQKSDASRWRGDFTARYIEDITSKTGNFKKFPVFVKMLLSAVKQASDSVFVDLLTYQDLEVLKSRRQGQQDGAQQQQRAAPTSSSNKRYLILTYAAEFDRVHYPLPLQFDDNPDPGHLRQVIVQLRSELAAARVAQQQALDSRDGGRHHGHTQHHEAGPAAEARRLREENATLRQQLRQLDKAVRSDLPDSERMSAEARELARELKAVRKERDLLHGRVEAADAEMEREQGLHRRELRRRDKETGALHDELVRARDEIRDLKIRIRQLEEALNGSSRSGRPAPYGTRASGDSAATGHSGDRYGGGSSTGRPSSRPTSGSNTRPRGGAPYGSSSSSAYAQPYQPPYAYARAASRGRDTSSRERGGPRPSSAPLAAGRSGSGRFDPTEWVRQRREARRTSGSGASSVGSGGASPSSSRHPSRPSSSERQRPAPAPPPPRSNNSSRPSSAERLHRGVATSSSAYLYPPHHPSAVGAPYLYNSSSSQQQRPRSSERDRQRPGSGGSTGSRGGYGAGSGYGAGGYGAASQPRLASPTAGGRASQYSPTGRPGSGGRTGSGGRGAPAPLYPGARERSPSPSASGRRSVTNAWGEPQGTSKFPAVPGAAPAPSQSERASSPGRALQEVKRKLSEYVANRSSGSAADGGAPSAGGSVNASGSSFPAAAGGASSSVGQSKAQLFEDTSCEIADIDSRLQSLQQFLKMAKGQGT